MLFIATFCRMEWKCSDGCQSGFQLCQVLFRLNSPPPFSRHHFCHFLQISILLSILLFRYFDLEQLDCCNHSLKPQVTCNDMIGCNVVQYCQRGPATAWWAGRGRSTRWRRCGGPRTCAPWPGAAPGRGRCSCPTPRE